MKQETNIKLKLWKKIGKSASIIQHDKISEYNSGEASLNSKNSNSIIKIQQPKVNSSRQKIITAQSNIQQHTQQIENVKSNDQKFDQNRGFCYSGSGSEIQNAQQSESIIEVNYIIQESQFEKYQQHFNNHFLDNPLLKNNVNIRNSDTESDQISPMTPFIDPSSINFSSRNLSKIICKLKQCKDKLFYANEETKSTHEIVQRFNESIKKFISQKKQQFQRVFLLKKSTNSTISVSSYLKQSEKMMIVQVDQSYQSFDLQKNSNQMSKKMLNDSYVEHNQNQHSDQNLDQNQNQKKSSISSSNQYQNQNKKGKHKQKTDPEIHESQFKEGKKNKQQAKLETHEHGKIKQIYGAEFEQGKQSLGKLSIFLSKQSNDSLRREDQINYLVQTIEQKDYQINELKLQMQKNKEQYLQYKRLFDSTNNELNNELDQMVQKFKGEEEKYLHLQNQFVKLNDLVSSKKNSEIRLINQNLYFQGTNSSKSSSSRPFQNELNEQLSKNASLSKITNLTNEIQIIKTQNIKLRNQNLILQNENLILQNENHRLSQLIDQKNIQLSSKIQEISSLKQEYQSQPTQLPTFSKKPLVSKSFSFGSQQHIINNLKKYSASKEKQQSRANLQELVKIKQQKLKQYELFIEQYSERQKQLVKQNKKLAKQVQKLTKVEQKLKILAQQLNETKNYLNDLSKTRTQLQQSNEKLYESIFDLQQKRNKTQSQCKQTVDQYQQILKQQRLKFDQLQVLYKQMLDKLSNPNQINTGICSISQLKIVPENQLITNELKIYKKLYEQKQFQFEEIKQKLQHKTHNFLINEQIQKEADRFRIESFKDDLIHQQHIIQKLKGQKQDLLKIINQQTKQLMQKTYLNEKLSLETKKLKMDIERLNQNMQKIIKQYTLNYGQNFDSCCDVHETYLPNNKKSSQCIVGKVQQYLKNQQFKNSNQNQNLALIQLLDKNLKKEQNLNKRQAELRQWQLKMQKEQNTLRLSKKQLQLEYQDFLKRYQDFQKSTDNKNSFNNLSCSAQYPVQQQYPQFNAVNKLYTSLHNERQFQQNQKIGQFQTAYPKPDLSSQIYINAGKLLHNTSTNLANRVSPSQRRLLQNERSKSPKQNFLKAQRILNSLKQRQFLPTSDRQKSPKIKFNESFKRPNSPRLYNGSSSIINTAFCNKKNLSPSHHRQKSHRNSPVKRIQIISPKPPNIRSPYNKGNQQKKLKIKLIEQKMRKLKTEVRDSLTYQTY